LTAQSLAIVYRQSNNLSEIGWYVKFLPAQK